MASNPDAETTSDVIETPATKPGEEKDTPEKSSKDDAGQTLTPAAKAASTKAAVAKAVAAKAAAAKAAAAKGKAKSKGKAKAKSKVTTLKSAVARANALMKSFDSTCRQVHGTKRGPPPVLFSSDVDPSRIDLFDCVQCSVLCWSEALWVADRMTSQAGRLIEQIGSKDKPGLDDWTFAQDEMFGPKLDARINKLKGEMELCDFFGPVVKGETETFDTEGYKPHHIESVVDERETALNKVKSLVEHIKQMHSMRLEAAEASASQ